MNRIDDSDVPGASEGGEPPFSQQHIDASNPGDRPDGVDTNSLVSFLSSRAAKYDAEYWSAVREGPFACLVFDVDSLDIVCVSRIAADFFGFSVEELENTDLSALWPAADFEARMRFIENSKRSDVGPSNGFRPFRTKDGEIIQKEFRFLDLDHPSRRLRIVFFPGIEGDGGWLLS